MQIINTYKCNFTCSHCMFSSNMRFKEMLSKNNFILGMQTFGGDEFINLCGGEAFLHPDIFWQIKFILWNDEYCNLRIPTNGSWILTPSGNYTKKFKEFIHTCNNEINAEKLTIMISDDWYHEEFHKHSVNTLISAITSETAVQIERDNRKMNNYILPLGRAKRNALSNCSNGCADCSDRFEPTILPNGDVAICCNGRQVIGNITESNDWDYWNSRYKALKIPEGLKANRCGSCKLYADKELIEKNLYEVENVE